MNCINTKNFTIKGKEYFARITIENGEMVVESINQIMDNNSNGFAKVIYQKQ